MSKKGTTEEFILKAIKKHGCFYDYSQVNYTTAIVPVTIICKTHGSFKQSPNKHLNGRGCSKCGKIKCAKSRESNIEAFINKARYVHKDKYLYNKTVYIKSDSKVTIECPLHGEFSQGVNTHLRGRGCKICGMEKSREAQSYKKEEVLEKFKYVHGDRYMYNMTTYKTTCSLIEVTCKKHGAFKQLVSQHLIGRGCTKCGYESSSEIRRKLPKELEKLARNVRRRVKSYISRRGYSKTSKTSIMLGISWEELKIYLEDNPYSFKIDNSELDLDHKVPLSSAKTLEDIYKFNHYTNLQLLPSKYNQFIKK